MTDRHRRDVTPFFNSVSRAYDNGLIQRLVYRPAQDGILEALRARGSRRVLDVGCGTGLMTARIARDVRPQVVYGCDLSDGMLAQAARRSSAVRWLQAPAEQVPLDDGSVDAVVSSHAFQFFDQPKALAEFHRLLEPGGVFALAVISARGVLAHRMLQVGRVVGNAHRPKESDVVQVIADAGFRIESARRAARPLGEYVPDLVVVATRP